MKQRTLAELGFALSGVLIRRKEKGRVQGWNPSGFRSKLEAKEGVHEHVQVY